MIFRVPPDVGLAPSALWTVLPKAMGQPFPQATALPSPASLPPTAARAGVGEGSQGAGGGGWMGRSLQAALGARPTSGDEQILQHCNTKNIHMDQNTGKQKKDKLHSVRNNNTTEEHDTKCRNKLGTGQTFAPMLGPKQPFKELSRDLE